MIRLYATPPGLTYSSFRVSGPVRSSPKKSELDRIYIKVSLKRNNIYGFYVHTYLKGFIFFISINKVIFNSNILIL